MVCGCSSNNREIHLVSTTWQELLTAPPGNPPALADFQSDAYGMTVPRRALLLGVRLRQRLQQGYHPQGGVFSQMKALARQATADDVPDLDSFRRGQGSAGGDLRPVRRWYPLQGRVQPAGVVVQPGPRSDVLIEERSDRLLVAGMPPIQMAAIRRFSVPKLSAPDDQWILDAVSHPGDAPHHISIRAELEPTSVTRGRARMSQRRINANIREEQETGDLEKVENSQTFSLAQELEAQLANSPSPDAHQVLVHGS